VKVFLIGDAAGCAKKDQKVPQGYYNTELMLRNVGGHGGEIGVCATCMDARGITDTELTDTTHGSTLEELTNWVQWADRTPKPAVRLRQPSWRWHLGKVWVEKSWLYTKL
jgi:uncharacterized protein involved in oxidation of intracellular sulfur